LVLILEMLLPLSTLMASVAVAHELAALIFTVLVSVMLAEGDDKMTLESAVITVDSLLMVLLIIAVLTLSSHDNGFNSFLKNDLNTINALLLYYFLQY